MMGFSSRWRRWIRGCFEPSFSVLVNCLPLSWFGVSRGVRQGGPLSPFLFTLVVNVLGRWVLREKRDLGTRVEREHISVLLL